MTNKEKEVYLILNGWVLEKVIRGKGWFSNSKVLGINFDLNEAFDIEMNRL